MEVEEQVEQPPTLVVIPPWRQHHQQDPQELHKIIKSWAYQAMDVDDQAQNQEKKKEPGEASSSSKGPTWLATPKQAPGPKAKTRRMHKKKTGQKVRHKS